MRYAPLLAVAVALTGCLKPAPPVQATTRAPLAIVSVLDSYEIDGVLEVPDAALEFVSAEVTEHNLEPVAVSLGDQLATARLTEQRLELAAAAAGGAPAVLLVETDARFGAQVNGRYRWSVTAELSIAPASDPNDLMTTSVNVPVHLVYYRDKEQAAVAEAAPVIARHVGQLLDGWIGATGQ